MEKVKNLTVHVRLTSNRCDRAQLPGANPAEVAEFWREYESAVRTHSAMVIALAKMLTKIERIQQVIAHSTADIGDMDDRVTTLRTALWTSINN